MKPLVEECRNVMSASYDITDLEQLDENVLRSLSVLSLLGKAKQYATRIDKEVNNLKNLSNRYASSKDENEKEILSQMFISLADIQFSQRKLTGYSTLVSATTGVGIDRNFRQIKKMEKNK